MKEITNEMIEKMAENTIGTCKVPENIFDALFPEYDSANISSKQWGIYDLLAYTCNGCGWVYEGGDQTDVDDEMYCRWCIDEINENFEREG